MKHFFLRSAIIVLSLLFAFSSMSLAQEAVAGVQTGVINVKFKPEAIQDPQGLNFSKRKGVIRTGMNSLDALSSQYTIVDIERIFPYSETHEARHREAGLHLWYTITYKAKTQPKSLSSVFSRLPEIQIAEPVLEKVIPQYQVYPSDLSQSKTRDTAMPYNDPRLNRQWHYHNLGQNGGTVGADINLFEAWKMVKTNPNIVVSIHDEGVDYAHEDLVENMWVNVAELNGAPGIDDDGNGYVDDIYGYNFARNGSKIDPMNHGTHVGGTVAAVNNNGIGVCGVAGGSGAKDGVKLMSCQILGGNRFDKMAASYVYAADNGAIISQNSWGYTVPDLQESVVNEAIDYFIRNAGNFPNSPMKGGIVIFAAGNDNIDAKMYPGYYPSCLVVTALNNKNIKAPYSNYGTWTEIAAPGGSIDATGNGGVLSTVPGNKYGQMEGTSMACPHVSGIAALIVSKNAGTGYTSDMLRRALMTGIKDDIYALAGNADYIGKLGVGRADAAYALKTDEKRPPATIENLAIHIGQDFATLSWTVPSDPDDGVPTEYEILYANKAFTSTDLTGVRRMTITAGKPQVGDAVTYDVEGLLPHTEYYFAVRSLDRWGNLSDLSNIVHKITNSGPVVALKDARVEVDIDVQKLSQQTRTVKIYNTGEGILKWSLFPRHFRNMDYINNDTSNEVILPGEPPVQPFSNLKAEVQERPDTNVINLSDQSKAQFLQLKQILIYDEYNYYYRLGEEDTTLPQSMAQRFTVLDSNGFNLTDLRMLLTHDTLKGRTILEIREGETLENSQLIYRDQPALNQLPGLADHFIQLREQLYFEYGSHFWVIMHLPAHQLYPLGAASEIEDDGSKWSYHSSDRGMSWQSLETASLNKNYVWAILPYSYKEPLHQYISLSKSSGTIAMGDSAEIEVTVDGSKLVNGRHLANLVLQSNDPLNAVERIPVVTKVFGQKPNFNLPAFMNLGSVMLGQRIRGRFNLVNTGYSTVENVQYALVDQENFAYSFDMFDNYYTVHAGQSLTLYIDFIPTKAGNFNSVFTITTPQGKFSSNVFGTAYEAPKIEVSPQYLTYDLSDNEDFEGEFKIKNTGKFPLSYYLPRFTDEAPSNLLTPYVHKAGYLATVLRQDISSFQWDDIRNTGTNINQEFPSGDDYRSQFIPIGFDFPFFGKRFSKVMITRYGLLDFVGDHCLICSEPMGYKYVGDSPENSNGSAIIAAIGHLIHLSQTKTITYKTYADRFVVNYDAQIQNYDESFKDIEFQIVLFDNGDVEFRYKNIATLGTWLHSRFYIGMEANDIGDGLCLKENFGPEGHMPPNMEMTNFMTIHIQSPGLGSVQQASNVIGGIAPDSTVTVQFKGNSSKYPNGNYKETLMVISNDPQKAEASVTLDLKITGQDGGAFKGSQDLTAVDFGSIFRYDKDDQTIVLDNTGDRSTMITDVQIPEGFECELPGIVPFEFKPFHKLYFKVSPKTETLGSFSGSMKIVTEDTTFSIQLSSEVIEQPKVKLSQQSASASVDLAQNPRSSATIRLSNEGRSELEYRIYGLDWANAIAGTNSVEKEGGLSYESRVYHKDCFETPNYNWIDILSTGIKVDYFDPSRNPLMVAEDYFYPVKMPFDFPFYENSYDTAYFLHNGAISFTKAEEVWKVGMPDNVPNPKAPNNLIMPLFGFVSPDPARGGNMYYKAFEDYVVFTFDKYIPSIGIGGSEFSSQVILFRDGTIKIQYKVTSQSEGHKWVTVGIENANGTKGIQTCAFNTFLQNGMVIYYLPSKTYTLSPRNADDLKIQFLGSALSSGKVQDQIHIESNAPETPSVKLSATLDVQGPAKLDYPSVVEMGHVIAGTEVCTTPLYCQEGATVPKRYNQKRVLSNSGVKAIVIDSIVHQKTQANNTDLKAYVWYSTSRNCLDFMEQIINAELYGYNVSKAARTLAPGANITLDLAYSPTGNYAELSDTIFVFTSISTTPLVIPVNGSVDFPPSIDISMDSIVIAAPDRNYQTEITRGFRNHGQSPLNALVKVSIDRGSSAQSNGTQSFSLANAMPKASGQGLRLPALIDAKPSKDLFQQAITQSDRRVLSHDHKNTVTDWLGVSNMISVTLLAAPENGFNVSELEVYFRHGEVKSSTLTAYVLSYHPAIVAAEIVSEKTFTIDNDLDNDEQGSLINVVLDSAAYFFPNEQFYIAFGVHEAEDGANLYPLAVADYGQAMPGTFLITDGTDFLDIQVIEGGETKGFIMNAVETNFIKNVWVDLISEGRDTLQPGDSATIRLHFDANFVTRRLNQATLSIESQDAHKLVKKIPIALTVNAGPLFNDNDLDISYTLKEKDTLRADIRISDFEGDAYTVDPIQYNIPGLSLTQTNTLITLIYAPDYGSAGVHSFTVNAADDKGNKSQCKVSFTVLKKNRQPLALDAHDIVLELGAKPLYVSYGSFFNDPDGDPLTFTMSHTNHLGAAEMFNGSTGVYLHPIHNGTFEMALTASDSKTPAVYNKVKVIVGNGSANKEQIHDARFELSPNPTSDIAIVRFTDQMKGPKTISLFSLDGRRLMQISCSAQDHEARISMHHYSIGAYLIEVECDGIKQSALLIRQ